MSRYRIELRRITLHGRRPMGLWSRVARYVIIPDGGTTPLRDARGNERLFESREAAVKAAEEWAKGT